jgi:N-acyl-D-aspartate/D-glutamate deacylase
MAEVSGRPLSFSLAQSSGDSWRRQLDLLTEANVAGVRMAGQTAPRPVGLLLGLQCTLHPLLGNPVHREIASLPPAEQAEMIAEPAFRARLLEANAAGRGARILQGFDRMFALGDPPDYEPRAEDSIAARAARFGRDPFDLACDLLANDEGRTFLYVPFLNYRDGNLDAVGEMLAHPHTVVGLADGGAHVGTICDASFPTTLLTLWGRDRDHGRLPLPFLVHRHTQATARTVGLDDRGVLAAGYRADVNVVDFDGLTARRPEMSHDLPAGGKRLVQRADGYVATVAKGEITYEHGVATDALPGRLVRGPQAAPSVGGTR